jgi:cephalosporin hydroxylase
MTNPAIIEYKDRRDAQAVLNMDNDALNDAVHCFTAETIKANYSKNYTWMGVPILQYPSDLMVMQELIWDIRPDVIIETGVAFGGMLMFYATCLEAIRSGRVIGIDIEIRDHNRLTINRHPLRHRIELMECSSTEIHPRAWFDKRLQNQRVLVSLDSNHTHDHVLQELDLYAPLVSVGSYIVVFDTAIEKYGQYTPETNFRPWTWGDGNNPASAVREFLSHNDDFVVDKLVETRALVTSAPGGWLRRIKR